MSAKRPDRTARRAAERAARKLVRDRERLAALEPGGSPARPIEVPSAAVIETRARATPCPQCAGELALADHQADAGVRVVSVRCRRCHVARRLWFRIAARGPN